MGNRKPRINGNANDHLWESFKTNSGRKTSRGSFHEKLAEQTPPWLWKIPQRAKVNQFIDDRVKLGHERQEENHWRECATTVARLELR